MKRPLRRFWQIIKKCWENYSGTIVYVVLAITVVILVGLIQERSKQSDQKLQEATQHSDRTIVRTGQLAIYNGCRFDNVRARELRKILFRSFSGLDRALASGRITRSEWERQHRNLSQSISDITIRDCKQAAKTLHLPKEDKPND